MDNNQKILGEFEKNSVEVVRISSVEYHSNQYLDVRIWIVGDQGSKENRLPTKKGIRIHSELLPDLIQALQQAKDLIRGSFDKSSNKRNEKI